MTGDGKTMIIGVGNEFRSDDGLGRAVARMLEPEVPEGVAVCESSGEALSLMELWADRDRVILVDASEEGETPGTVTRFDATKEALPTDYFHASTHAFSVAEAIEMARSLDQLPKQVIVYGIQGLHFEHGSELSDPAREGAAAAVKQILKELS